MGHPSKRPRDRGQANETLPDTASLVNPVIEAGESDDEYEDIPVRSPKPLPSAPPESSSLTEAIAREEVEPSSAPLPEDTTAKAPQTVGEATDDDWLRSRTNRLLDLVDLDDPGFTPRPTTTTVLPAETAPTHSKPTVVPTENEPAVQEPNTAPPKSAKSDDPLELLQQTSRLFLRNLSYNITEDDIREHFSPYGSLQEVGMLSLYQQTAFHDEPLIGTSYAKACDVSLGSVFYLLTDVQVSLPLDKEGRSKGFAMIQYEGPSSAVAAFQLDGTTFQGRLIHILPAAAKRESKLDEFAISKLPLKKQQLLRKKAEAASSTFNWNSLFMSQDAVNTAISERLGVSKHELLDPTDASAAVKQAVAETTVIQEAKDYFATNGVNIEAFKSQQRGDTCILVKNIRDTKTEELRQLFEEHGPVLRVLMPPSGTIAIVQFAQPAHCKAAFARKAYSRFKDSVLFLEKGPKGLLIDPVAPQVDPPTGVKKVSAADLLERDDAGDELETASLFVRNLSFSTTSEGLTNAFKNLDGFVSAKVKTKTDPKKPGQVLSMGFGFCAFRTKAQAQAALKAMDGFLLDGHKLGVKASHRGLDAAEEQRKQDLAKKIAAQRTKLVIKNLPFEASKKDVRALFATYGKVVALRIPKKFNSDSRGFAFAEFSTAKEALNAFNSLKDTHLLGRRLVIDFAEAEEVDPEEQIKAMEKKMRGQADKVALQQLTGRGRTKINIGNDDEDEA
ncbi:hypothetical protein OQA88_3939 [Cercophora sp. LCS_1]